jgi:phage tail-like protein
MRRPEIERLLPKVFQLALHPDQTWALAPDTRLGAVLDAMESLHQPIEDILDSLAEYVDPRRAKEPFVPYLAGWVDLDWLVSPTPDELEGGGAAIPSTGLGHLRELVAHAAQLARWRGTSRGLLSFIETATGLHGFTIDEAALDDQKRPMPFHIVVNGPAEAAPFQPLIERIVRSEKPAYVTHELRFAPAPQPPG